jgi:MoaA/NifB/PqqE/SkfB family radical SAM enzyme
MTSLWFGGGEPTLRDDLFGLVAAARALGYERVLVQTNGLRLAYPAYAAALVRAGATDLRFNIKSHDSSLHDSLSGGEAHALLVRALENLRGKGVRLAADVLLTKKTAPELEATVRFFAARGISRFVLWLLSASDSRDEQVAREIPRIADLAPWIAKARDACRTLGVELESLHTPPCTLPPELRDVFVPASSLELTVVDPGGHTFPLESSPFEGGAYVPACEACSERPRCGGPRADYVAIFGANEFQSLRLQPQVPPPPHD